MKTNRFSVKPMLSAIFVTALLGCVSCSDDDSSVSNYQVDLTEQLPDGVPAGYSVKSGKISCHEINTGVDYLFSLPSAVAPSLPAGTYDVDATMVVTYPGEDTEHTFRAVSRQQVVSANGQSINLAWFHFNPTNTLVFALPS